MIPALGRRCEFDSRSRLLQFLETAPHCDIRGAVMAHRVRHRSRRARASHRPSRRREWRRRRARLASPSATREAAAAPPRRVARVAARCVASEPDAVRVTRATGRTVALVASSAACASAATPAHALSDAWFGWYFAPGGFALGPALFLTAFLLGQAVFEKVTGTGPSKDRSDDEKR